MLKWNFVTLVAALLAAVIVNNLIVTSSGSPLDEQPGKVAHLQGMTAVAGCRNLTQFVSRLKRFNATTIPQNLLNTLNQTLNSLGNLSALAGIPQSLLSSFNFTLPSFAGLPSIPSIPSNLTVPSVG